MVVHVVEDVDAVLCTLHKPLDTWVLVHAACCVPERSGGLTIKGGDNKKDCFFIARAWYGVSPEDVAHVVIHEEELASLSGGHGVALKPPACVRACVCVCECVRVCVFVRGSTDFLT